MYGVTTEVAGRSSFSIPPKDRHGYQVAMLRSHACGTGAPLDRRAARAAAALEKELGVKPELSVGSPGSFQVWVDGKVVAEKHLMGFPTEEEIVGAVGAALGQKAG